MTSRGRVRVRPTVALTQSNAFLTARFPLPIQNPEKDPLMNLRHLRFFVTLARERHYGRAASACNVTQPTLSEAIRQLERELSVPLVDRDRQRFRDLTPEGDRVLAWAQRILADQDAMEQELAEMHGSLTGDLRFGVIPAAMPVVPLLTAVFCRSHPLVTPRILSLTSIEIQRGLDAGELEAGMTYLDNEPLRNVRAYPLYSERYMLLTRADRPLGNQAIATWRDAAQLPMCLLTRDMQNRRIINGLFIEGGADKVRVVIETNSVVAQIAHVRTGGWSSVVPHTFLTLLGRQDAELSGLRAIPLVDPEASQSIGLVVADRDPLPSLAKALLATAEHAGMPYSLDCLLPTLA